MWTVEGPLKDSYPMLKIVLLPNLTLTRAVNTARTSSSDLEAVEIDLEKVSRVLDSSRGNKSTYVAERLWRRIDCVGFQTSVV